MPVHPAKLQQLTPIWYCPSSLRAWSTYQVNGRTWRPRFRSFSQQSWRAVMVSLLKAKWKQVLPVAVMLHWQLSLELALKIAGQFGLERQPGFAAATEQTSAVVQPCSTYNQVGGYRKQPLDAHTEGPNHTNQFQLSWHLEEGNQPYCWNHL